MKTTAHPALPCRSRLRRTLCAAGVALALGAGALAPAHATEQWQAYTYWGTPTVLGSKGFRKLVEDIEQASGGALKIKLNLGGTLSIKANNIASAVGDDVVQFADDIFNQGTVPIVGLAGLPFLTGNVDEVHKVMKTLFPIVEREFAKRNVTTLGYYVYPPQVFWFRDKVTSLSQIKGRKVRVFSPEQGDVVRRLGATPVQLGSAEVPAALERGVVDGILTASAGGIAAWKEMLKSSYVMNFNYAVSFIQVNRERFNKLPPPLQAKIREVVARNMAALTEELQREDGVLRKQLEADGMFTTYASREDMAQAEEVAKASWDAWAKARGPETVDTLTKVRAVLSR